LRSHGERRQSSAGVCRSTGRSPGSLFADPCSAGRTGGAGE
jgi:hypothetical protein